MPKNDHGGSTEIAESVPPTGNTDGSARGYDIPPDLDTTPRRQKRNSRSDATHTPKAISPCYHGNGESIMPHRFTARYLRALDIIKAIAAKERTTLIVGSDTLTKPTGDAQSRTTRRMLRHQWQPNSKVAREIEAAVSQLLSAPAQAALAARQTEEAAKNEK